MDNDLSAKQRMLDIAKSYDHIAEVAEKRVKLEKRQAP
jgi:hypothetical protein